MYDIEKRDDGWAVVSVDTGETALVNGVLQCSMSLDDADDLADLLNGIEADRPVKCH